MVVWVLDASMRPRQGCRGRETLSEASAEPVALLQGGRGSDAAEEVLAQLNPPAEIKLLQGGRGSDAAEEPGLPAAQGT